MPKTKLSRAKRKGPHRAGRKETQAQYSARVEREGKPPFGPISKANTGAAPTTPCDHVAPRKGCSYCQQRLRMQEETLDRTTKLLLGGNVADYFEAALEMECTDEAGERLSDCPLISVCGIECKEVIDAGRILLRSMRAHLPLEEHLRRRDQLVSAIAYLCEVIYCG